MAALCCFSRRRYGLNTSKCCGVTQQRQPIKVLLNSSRSRTSSPHTGQMFPVFGGEESTGAMVGLALGIGGGGGGGIGGGGLVPSCGV